MSQIDHLTNPTPTDGPSIVDVGTSKNVEGKTLPKTAAMMIQPSQINGHVACLQRSLRKSGSKSDVP
jgi:hypothetical protein